MEESEIHKINSLKDTINELYEQKGLNIDTQHQQLLKHKLKRNPALNIVFNDFIDKHFQSYEKRKEVKDELFDIVSKEFLSIFVGFKKDTIF